jgi:hypothetical protein
VAVDIPLHIVVIPYRRKGLEPVRLADLRALGVCGFLVLLVVSVVWVE